MSILSLFIKTNEISNKRSEKQREREREKQKSEVNEFIFLLSFCNDKYLSIYIKLNSNICKERKKEKVILQLFDRV